MKRRGNTQTKRNTRKWTWNKSYRR